MTLPQKIRLLADFAGYPAGEYAYYDEKGFPSYLQSYIAGDEPVVVNIHPDIIKATSGQGIRSEVTDGEESVDRQLEKKCICRKGRIENEWGVDEECPRCTGEEITPDPYEECANELDPLPETIQGMEVVVDHKKVIEILKKYLQPKQ